MKEPIKIPKGLLSTVPPSYKTDPPTKEEWSEMVKGLLEREEIVSYSARIIRVKDGEDVTDDIIHPIDKDNPPRYVVRFTEKEK